MRLVNVGFGNMISGERLISVIGPDSAPVKRMIQEAREAGSLIDATYGRRTRAVLIMDSGHIVLSALQPETLTARVSGRESAPGFEEKEEDTP